MDIGRCIKIAQLKALIRKPTLYEKGTLPLWTDEHISKGMLEAHLSPDRDAATKKRETVEKTVGWISSVAPAEEYRELLDLGCGPGIYAELFHKAGYRVSGVDFSERSIRYARNSAEEKNLPISYYHQNYLTMDFKARFDLLTLIYYDFGVLSTEARAALLQRAFAALRPGGLLILDVYTPRRFADKHTEYTRWQYADESFFCVEPHLRLESFFVYEEQNTFCEQHILLTESGVKHINIWEHAFTRNELERDVRDAGFAVRGMFGSIDGAPYSDDGEEMCVIAEKEEDPLNQHERMYGMEIRLLAEPDLAPAMELVWKVFREFEAPDYSEEGVREFQSYIELASMERRFAEGTLFLWGAFEGARIVGVIASRKPCHVSLLFVRAEYHRRGIARALFHTMLAWHRENAPADCVTVNSSPYAAEVYHRLGFGDTSAEQTVNGIRFIPMKAALVTERKE